MTPKEVSDIIHRLVQDYDMDPYDINCGMCESFAQDLVEALGETAEMGWGDEWTGDSNDHEEYAYHCIVRYEGRFYDAEHPEGVDDFHDISAFHSKGKP